MKERPILFSGEMVKAILDGRKTQTRRLIMHQGRPLDDFAFYEVDGDEVRTESGKQLKCKYGQPGDRLWVRETWRVFGGHQYEYQQHQPSVLYRADFDLFDEEGAWRPSIFMPRWASRITLEITKVRVERLDGISEEDAMAEGVQSTE